MTTIAPTAPVETGLGERTTYAAYFAGQNIVYTLIQGYLLMFTVSSLKLNPALVATLFLVVRVWDAVNDPMIGIFMDRFRFSSSRYKRWLNLTAFLVPISTFAMFAIPADASQTVKVVLLIVTYLIWDVLYTASEVPIFAVSTSMTNNERERTILLTLTQIGSVFGVLVGMVAMHFLVEEGVDRINWILVGAIPSVLAALFMIPQMFSIQERHHTQAVEEVSLGQMIREVLRNDQHFIIMSVFTSQAFFNAVTVFALYVAEGYYGNAQLATATSLASLVGILGLGALTPRIVQWIGKQRYLEYAMLATIVFSIPVFFIPREMPVLAMVFLGLRTTTLVVTSLLRPMFTADCIEYGQHKTGVRNDSTAFAIQTFFNKTGDAIGVALGGFVLALVAFNEELDLAAQAAGTIDSLWVWYVVLPMLMAAAMYIVPKLWYRLDEATVKRLIAENEAAGGD